MEFVMDLFMLLGRICISGMFLWTAYEKIMHWNTTMTYMKTKHVPQVGIVMPVCVALQVIGGLSVLIGWHAHLGAVLLLIVALFSAAKLHAFWSYQGDVREVEKALFMKDVAIIGGLLLILAMGAGHLGAGGGG